MNIRKYIAGGPQEALEGIVTGGIGVFYIGSDCGAKIR